jgi:hypothetical protein
MTTLYDDKMWDEYWESEEWKKHIPVHPRNSKIFSASTAREKLNKVLENDDKELIEIMEKIEGAINRKQNYTYVSASIGNHTIKKLQNLGYTIGDILKGDRPFDPDTRKISW